MRPIPTDEKVFSIGQSKIGGQPDLPINIDWFNEDNGKPLSFIAQFNLAEITKFDNTKQLPTKGILYFFYSANQDAWGFDIKDKDKFKVFYLDDNTINLVRRDFPKDLPEYSRYKVCKLVFNSSLSLPDFEEECISKTFNNEEADIYYDLIKDVGSYSKLLGHPNITQNPMALQCELVTNGLYCGNETGYNDPKAKELEKNIGEWMLLFQVESDYDETGMLWGNFGRLYYWIKKEDFININFQNCWLISQC